MSDPVTEPLFAASRLEGEPGALAFLMMIDFREDSEPTMEAIGVVQETANFIASRNPPLPEDGSLLWGGRPGSQLRLKPENLDSWLARAIHFRCVARQIGDRLQIEITGVGPTTMEEPRRPN